MDALTGSGAARLSDLALSVVVPVFNEAATIERVLRNLERYATVENEILIVYDFDEDNTLPVIRQLDPPIPAVQLVRNSRGRGVLNAMRTGIAAARGNFVLITMADGSDDLRDLPRMLAAAETGAVVVAASRYMPGGAQRGGPRLKGALSRIAGVTLHILGGLPIHDPTSNFKLYSRAFLASVTIESHGGFEMALELSVKAYRQRLRMVQVPTTWVDRTAGRSHFSLWRWLPHYLRWFASGITARFVKGTETKT